MWTRQMEFSAQVESLFYSLFIIQIVHQNNMFSITVVL